MSSIARKDRRVIDIDHLVTRVAAVTGDTPPAVLAADAPVPTEAGVLDYVALVGGKDVGKTSLANAIAGVELAPPVGHGEGTRTAFAHAHRSVVTQVKEDLAWLDEALTVVPHDVDRLRRTVLLDLPDIDSRYEEHVRLTRRVLRHVLYPVWIQSVEKYADARPRELLKAVAEGNDPGNFLFVLSKADQVADREGEAAALEIAADFGERVARALDLPTLPEVHVASAHRPDAYDLPRLRARLGIDRDDATRADDAARAKARRQTSIATWLAKQNLPARADAADRLLEEATNVLADRVASPMLEHALPRLAEDPGHRMALAEPAAKAATRAWPLVGWIDLALSPVVSVVRANLLPAASESAALETFMSESGQSTARNVRAAFAHLHATHPAVAEMFKSDHLWSAPAAEAATSVLRQRLDAALSQQRAAVAEAARPRRWLAPLRWLLTVGVALWFVIAQPVLTVLLPRTGDWSWPEIAMEAVALLSAQALLASAGLVATYLLILWAAVRLRAYRRVAKLREKLDRLDADASPARAVVAWTQDLVGPLRRHRDDLRALADAAAVAAK
jgi:hypothetical protein